MKFSLYFLRTSFVFTFAGIAGSFPNSSFSNPHESENSDNVVGAYQNANESTDQEASVDSVSRPENPFTPFHISIESEEGEVEIKIVDNPKLANTLLEESCLLRDQALWEGHLSDYVELKGRIEKIVKNAGPHSCSKSSSLEDLAILLAGKNPNETFIGFFMKSQQDSEKSSQVPIESAILWDSKTYDKLYNRISEFAGAEFDQKFGSQPPDKEYGVFSILGWYLEHGNANDQLFNFLLNDIGLSPSEGYASFRTNMPIRFISKYISAIKKGRSPPPHLNITYSSPLRIAWLRALYSEKTSEEKELLKTTKVLLEKSSQELVAQPMDDGQILEKAHQLNGFVLDGNFRNQLQDLVKGEAKGEKTFSVNPISNLHLMVSAYMPPLNQQAEFTKIFLENGGSPSLLVDNPYYVPPSRLSTTQAKSKIRTQEKVTLKEFLEHSAFVKSQKMLAPPAQWIGDGVETFRSFLSEEFQQTQENVFQEYSRTPAWIRPSGYSEILNLLNEAEKKSDSSD